MNFAPDVDPPARQARGQSDVLSFPTDRQRKLIVRRHDRRRSRLLIDDHSAYFSRAQSAGHIPRRIVAPANDIHLLPAQLIHDRLHAAPAVPHTGPDRIYILLLRHDRHLRASPRLSRLGLQLNDALVNLRHLQLEQLAQEPRVAARYEDPRDLRRALHFEDIDLQPLAHPIAVQRVLLRARKHRLHPTQVDEHGPAVAALHHPGHHIAVAIAELLIDDVALGLPDPLRHDLFRRLRGNPPEILRRHLNVEVLVFLHRRIQPPRIGQRHLRVWVLDMLHNLLPAEDGRISVIPVDVHVDLGSRAVVFLVCRDERGLDDLAQRLERDIFFPSYIAQRLYEIDLHFRRFLTLKSGTRPTLPGHERTSFPT